MAGVPDEYEDTAGEIIEREPPETPEMLVRLEVPDGVTLKLIVNGVQVDLDD
jgi:hypothetical protein